MEYQINITQEQIQALEKLRNERYPTAKYFRIDDQGDGIGFFVNDEMKPICVILRNGDLRGAGA